MKNNPSLRDSADEIASLLRRLSPAYAPTPLLPLPGVARHTGVAAVFAKDETKRCLGSFKSLGGTYAGLRAIARHRGCGVAELIARPPAHAHAPVLLTASAGNHGLAVAAAARFGGARARIYLSPGVPAARAKRIADQGADIVWVEGTYDDAVAAAAKAAAAGDGVLVADTSADPMDPGVADVMAGYGVLGSEIKEQSRILGEGKPTHVFVQAGVGGLAAALVNDLRDWLDAPARFVAVEPDQAACLTAALEAGRPLRIPGALATAGDMLACGEASAPAFEILRGAITPLTVSEKKLNCAPDVLAEAGVPTTASGAAGLAGLQAAAEAPTLRTHLQLTAESRVLLIVTEARG
jgi:diaminopropionate ammonia-lyase